jgi:hypothetical protein
MGQRALGSIMGTLLALALLLGSTTVIAEGAAAAAGRLPLKPLLLTIDRMPTGWTVGHSTASVIGTGCPKPKCVKAVQNASASFAGSGSQVVEQLRVYSPSVQKGYAGVVASLDHCRHEKLGSITASLTQMSLPSLGNASQAFDASWTHKGKTSNLYEVVIRSGYIIVTVGERGAPSISQFEDFATLALHQLGTSGTTKVAPVTTTTSPPPTTTTTTVPPTTTTTTRPPPPPTTTTPPPGQEAAFSCSGTAPEGVDITYGTDTSNLSGGGTVPWSATLALPSTVEYANVSAQLQGPDGTITCTTTVTWTQGGRSHSVTQTGTASGDYNIASAQVCSDFSGGFQTC